MFAFFAIRDEEPPRLQLSRATAASAGAEIY